MIFCGLQLFFNALITSEGERQLVIPTVGVSSHFNGDFEEKVITTMAKSR